MISKKLIMFVYIVILTSFIYVDHCECYNYSTYYFDQKIDHFGYSIQNTFQQRYLLNLDFYNSKNGSIFFYTGNEGAIEMFANNTGFMWENAEAFNAALVFAEHRYYGTSMPFGKDSFKSNKYLGYLSSEQALADFATLIFHLKSVIPGGENAPVISFGGSYGGMLSAWIRMKYPHVVDGSIASSAPIFQFITSCEKFNAIVTQDFKDCGIECAKSIKRSWSIIRKYANTDAGCAFLTKQFHLCEPLKFDNSSDLIDWLSSTWSYLAMTNYPYSTSFLIPLPPFPIKATCEFLTNSSVSEVDLIKNIVNAASIFHNFTGDVKCYDLKNSGGVSLGEKGWDYQACTEMVMPMCSQNTTDMFEPSAWNYTEYSKSCYEKWGVLPDSRKAIINYGGKNISAASNIIFTNGKLDPWYPGGVLENYSDTLLGIQIKDAAHHLDLRSSDPADPVSVIETRKILLKWIHKWIMQKRKLYNN